jgi:formylglycine-generating enzyme required for sulfatase activity
VRGVIGSGGGWAREPRTLCALLVAALLAAVLIGWMTSLGARVENALAAGPPGMRWVPAGEFMMGSDDPKARADERPAHRVSVDGFWIDATAVTNSEFRRFVDATGYLTLAERSPDWDELKVQLPPGTPKPAPEMLVAGSAVFRPTASAVPLSDWSRWWGWQPGASWRHPDGPNSSMDGKDDHPVVQIAWTDAVAYAEWAGKRLPTEAEWEYAARGGLGGKRFAWGDNFQSDGRNMANIWQGTFPVADTGADGFKGTAPVASFPPNGYGLYEMTGNVWQHVADWYRPDAYREPATSGVVSNPLGPAQSFDPDEPYAPKRVIRGGSFLCNEAFCFSYRPAARMKLSPDTGLPNVGFRLVINAPR